MKQSILQWVSIMKNKIVNMFVKVHSVGHHSTLHLFILQIKHHINPTNTNCKCGITF